MSLSEFKFVVMDYGDKTKGTTLSEMDTPNYRYTPAGQTAFYIWNGEICSGIILGASISPRNGEAAQIVYIQHCRIPLYPNEYYLTRQECEEVLLREIRKYNSKPLLGFPIGVETREGRTRDGCPNCGSLELRTTKDPSGWAHTDVCKTCHAVFETVAGDAMGGGWDSLTRLS